MDSQAAAEEEPPPLTVVTFEDFQAAVFMKPIEGTPYVDCWSLQQFFNQEANEASPENQEKRKQVFGLLGAICGLHFKPEDRAEPYGPMWQSPEGRSLIPADFVGEQAGELAKLLPTISHPGLRARIADILWFNDRKRKEAASAALDAYCESVEGLLNKRFKTEYEEERAVSNTAVKLFHRALQIASATSKRGQLPEKVQTLGARLHEATRSAADYVQYAHIGDLLLGYELVAPAKVAQEAEELALKGSSFPHPMPVKDVWDLAARAYNQINDQAARDRCRLESVERTLDMQKQVTGAGAAAHWIRTAIAELKIIPRTQEKREALRLEMRRLQEQAQDDFATFSVPIDLSELRASTEQIFEGLTLPQVLAHFAVLSRSRPLEELKREAWEGIKNSPLVAMMGSNHLDDEGKIVAVTPGAPTQGEPSEEWYKSTIVRNMSLARHTTLGGQIEPARQLIMANHPLSERHFMPIVQHSPFIPATHAHIFALGFARFMQGDAMSAAHLLLPQVENSIRYVLKNHNVDVSKIKSDMNQEDPSLSAILEQYRSELEKIFTAPIVNELDLLFIHRPGPALRHEFAHGKVSSGQCFGLDVLYACWFIYHLCCLPLIPHWGKLVDPQLATEIP